MNKRILFVPVVFCAILSLPVWAINEPTIDSGRVYPGVDQRGLIRSPSSIESRGNQLITGNIAGSKYFRGSVPYQSPLEFGAGTSSSTLNSFLRRSAGSAIGYRYQGSPTPYYTPWSTYGRRSLGGGSTVTMPRARNNNRAVGETAASSVFSQQGQYSFYGSGGGSSEVTSTFMSQKLQQIQKDILFKASRYPMGGEELIDEQGKLIRGELKVDLQRIDDKAPALKYRKFNSEKALESFMTKENYKDSFERGETEVLKNLREEEEQRDVYDEWEEELAFLGQGQQLEQVRTNLTKQTAVDTTKGDEVRETSEQSSDTGSLRSELSKAVLSAARTGSIMGESKDFASYLERNYREHIEEGEQLLKDGKYYPAADAFRLALAYKSDEHEAFAGRAHALFGAGEYVSSVFFLSEALEIYPEYAGVEVDIESAMGGRDIIESRLVDAEKWAQESESGELHFLVAYFYYRLGRIERAKERIDIAAENLPQRAAAAALKKVIYESAGIR